MSKLYRVIPTENGWKIKGLRRKTIFRTKKDALLKASEAAQRDKVPVIVHSKDGVVTDVKYLINSVPRVRRIPSEIKLRMSRKEMRNLVAQVIYERESGELNR